jgi:Response regulators consisting of a CheY-like receiver domain and a winged-helix DNA-binding domain
MKKILIVDDAEDIVSSLTDLLEESGYETFCAYSAVSAIEITKKVIPNLILCDILMPQIDGYEYLKQLKSNISTSNIPVIFLSAGAEKSEVERGMNAGVEKFILKPYDAVDLIKTIETLLSD